MTGYQAAKLSELSSNSGSGTKLQGNLYWKVLDSSVSVYVNVWTNQSYGTVNITTSVTLGSNTMPQSVNNLNVDASGVEYQIFHYSFPLPDNDVSITAAVSVSSTYFNGTMRASGSVSPGYGPSTITLGASSVQMGKKLLISLTRDHSSCTHTLKYSFGGSSANIASNVGSSTEWTVPDLASKCNNATSGTCTITCTTYLNNKSLGSTTAKVTLTVPDPTTPSIDGGDTVTLGSSSKVNCKRNSTNFTMRLELEFKNTTTAIEEGKIESADWTPGYDLAKLIPNLTYGTGQLKCTTYNGTAEVGSKTVTVRVVVPDNEVTRPAFTVDGLVLSPVSSLPEAFAGLYMRGKTGVKAEFDATSEYSTIADYAITVGSQKASGNPAAIDLLISEGEEVKVTAKVTDARGYSTTVTTSIPVLPYQNPKVIPCTGQSGVICERATENGGLSANGTYLAIKAGKRFSSVILNGEEQNSCILRYRWKPNGGNYCEWITLLAENSDISETELLVGNVVNSLQTSYMVEIEAADALGGVHTLTFQIMTEAVSFVLFDGPDGAGFGKYPEAAHVVDIASHMTLLVRGRLVVVSADWNDLGLAIGINEALGDCGRKKDPGCHWQVANGNHVYVAFDCSFEYTGTALTINSTAIPEEYRPHRTTYVFCPVSGGMALVSANPDGYIRVEWVQYLTETARISTTPVEWIDGYLDYWT